MSEVDGSPQVPQGWYYDGNGEVRWWDGRRWTEHVQPGVPLKAAVGANADRSADPKSERDAERQAIAARKHAVRAVVIDRRNAERREKEAAALAVREQKRVAKAAKQAQKESDRVAKIAAREAELAAWDRVTGKQVFMSSFGLTAIVLYENGYARFGVSLLGMTGEPGAPEKLLGAKTTTQVQDKSAGGRAVAAGMTMGLSMLASNEKRLIFLTITTDKQVRVMKAEGDMMRTVDKAAMEIVARAEALIEQSASLPIAVRQVAHNEEPGTKQADVIEKIRRLAELRDAGILSADEFESKKAELLSRI
ncbi:DUF2510 domain-containing protein [Microbacterium esteraromaticum]|uniref:DUF2510 domain-containing protein n=1 Tax=Microbacterium esteraromaticum TaxID=57043 RepID=UPI0030B1E84D